jgi:glyceraldehyde-3-phosphate dehydrogenase (NAD(P))
MTGLEREAARSIEKTNRSLGIVKSFLPKTMPEDAIHAATGERLAEAQRALREAGFKGSEEPAELPH